KCDDDQASLAETLLLAVFAFIPMLRSPTLIPPCTAFWNEAARLILRNEHLNAAALTNKADFSSLRILVPTVLHAQMLRAAIAENINHSFIPPRISTMDAWLSLCPPVEARPEAARVAALYAELRNHGWLKQLFSARRNTDLLPLAQTLICLSDELTQAMLPLLRLSPDEVKKRWQDALSHLPARAKAVLSEEAQLVWAIWKGQLDANDRCAARYTQMMRLAETANEPLVWISPVEPSPLEQAFLSAYGNRQTVVPILLDWRARMLRPAFAAAWPEIANDPEPISNLVESTQGIFLCQAHSLEQEAQLGAQTVIDWLVEGRSRIAIVAQDRVVARRLRALLERARIGVTDETGWKLSTTRAASLLSAWFDVVTTRADTASLLDFLKSPYLAPSLPERASHVMNIEMILRRANVTGGWEAILSATDGAEREWIARLREASQGFTAGRRELCAWISQTLDALAALDAIEALQSDPAGTQLLALLESMKSACAGMQERMSFAEWRAYAALQVESAPFIAPQSDKRVVMLPLNGARLRSFDAVLVVGADADNLPSRPGETLFFSNTVRRELGLATRESLQRQQLRDFCELLQSNAEVVLSWQSVKNGEHHPASPWLQRLQLVLEKSGVPALPAHKACIEQHRLRTVRIQSPRPSASHLLPTRLSASAYNSLSACPYQFFAGHMLGLRALDDVSDLPEKRDYGEWLHHILHEYHEALANNPLPADARLAKLREMSERRFENELSRSAAALGYYVRWQKAMPAYIAWCEEREKDGWRYEAGELKRESRLAFDGGEVTLHGRIDRIDRNAAGELAVLDYKTKPLDSLKKRLKNLEDHQLAFYGLLMEQPVADACYVALEPKNGRIGHASADDQTYPQRTQALSERAVETLAALSSGAAMPANGVQTICAWCNVRGLCRKGMW
ncbi:MAG: nuclease family protein, partial [Paucimonas sp.]|nr:nuclease family protein [Paucimonas sp.]